MMECFIEKRETIDDMCPDKMIYYDPIFDEYGLKIYDGGSSQILILFCPWCGKKLPNSKKERWFEELEKLGYEDISRDNALIPSNYKSSKWWNSR